MGRNDDLANATLPGKSHELRAIPRITGSSPRTVALFCHKVALSLAICSGATLSS
jgi:hypothetical protein